MLRLLSTEATPGQGRKTAGTFPIGFAAARTAVLQAWLLAPFHLNSPG